MLKQWCSISVAKGKIIRFSQKIASEPKQERSSHPALLNDILLSLGVFLIRHNSSVRPERRPQGIMGIKRYDMILLHKLEAWIISRVLLTRRGMLIKNKATMECCTHRKDIRSNIA